MCFDLKINGTNKMLSFQIITLIPEDQNNDTTRSMSSTVVPAILILCPNLKADRLTEHTIKDVLKWTLNFSSVIKLSVQSNF